MNDKMRTVVEQEVYCAFGENHKVTVELEGQMLRNISCSCYSNRKEVTGFIKLGELKDTTCLQAMNYLKDKLTNTQNYMFGYGQSPYADTPLNVLSDTVRRNVNEHRAKRINDRAHLEEIQRRNTEGIVHKRLTHILKRVLGEAAASAYIINKGVEGYSFYLKGRSQDTKIAIRSEGLWFVQDNVEDLIMSHPVNRNCPYCDVVGVYHHDQTKSHKKTIVRKTFIALQATSGLGIRKYHKEEKNEDFDPTTLFRYRKTAKSIPGIVRAAPFVVPPGDSNG